MSGGGLARLFPMARSVNPIQDRARRAALEKAAYLALYERGYAGVTLADIAGHAGVSKGTLAYHFGSRAGLLAAVMRRFTRTITVATRRALRQAETPGAKLRAYVENQFYGVENTRRFYTVSLDFLAAATPGAIADRAAGVAATQTGCRIFRDRPCPGQAGSGTDGPRQLCRRLGTVRARQIGRAGRGAQGCCDGRR